MTDHPKIFPVISAIFWLATLLGLLLYWVVSTHYAILPSMLQPSTAGKQSIAYISDVGATPTMKPWFIVGAIFTTVFLDLGFFADRWLRHQRRLAPNTSLSEKILSGLCMIFAVVGTVGLCCLSGFDTYRHKRLHDIFLACFIGGYWFSAVFICAEYQRLGKKYRQHRTLRLSFWIKLVFIILELALVVVFGVMNVTGHYNLAAIFEWIVSFVFTFYVLSFIVDLWPAVHSGPERRYSLNPMRSNEIGDDYRRTHGAAGLPRDTIDSERTLGGADSSPHSGVVGGAGAGGGLAAKKNGHTDF